MNTAKVPNPIDIHGRNVNLNLPDVREMAQAAYDFRNMQARAPLSLTWFGGRAVLTSSSLAVRDVTTMVIDSIDDGDTGEHHPPKFRCKKQGWLPNLADPSPGDGLEVYEEWQGYEIFPRIRDSIDPDDIVDVWVHPFLYKFVAASQDSAGPFDYTDSTYGNRKPLSFYYKVGQVVTVGKVFGFPQPVVIDIPEYGVNWIWVKVDEVDEDTNVTTAHEVIAPDNASTWTNGTFSVTNAKELNGKTAEENDIAIARRADGMPIDLDDPAQFLLYVAPAHPEQEVFKPGDIKMCGSDSEQDGWLLCDGKEYSEGDYPALALKIGHNYGGTGSAFKVPDMRLRFPIGTYADGDAAPEDENGDPLGLDFEFEGRFGIQVEVLNHAGAAVADHANGCTTAPSGFCFSPPTIAVQAGASANVPSPDHAHEYQPDAHMVTQPNPHTVHHKPPACFVAFFIKT